MHMYLLEVTQLVSRSAGREQVPHSMHCAVAPCHQFTGCSDVLQTGISALFQKDLDSVGSGGRMTDR